MKTTIETIDHNKQRYETCGDYWEDLNGDVQIRVSDTGNEDYNFLIALHELIEQKLCKKRNISEESITRFDIDFESKRVENNTDEPGDDPASPYQNEHLIATGIEKLVCALMGLTWKDYDNTVNNLQKR